MESDTDGTKVQDHLQTQRRSFGTFWSGRLSAMERACLYSFAAQDQEITLFSYDTIPDVPEGVRIANASDILPQSATTAFLYNGRPHLVHFSDYFRYAMIKKANLAWVDCSAAGGGDWPSNLFAREPAGTINGAILYTHDQRLLATLLAETEKLMQKDLTWGETGPVLLQRVLQGAGLEKDAGDHSVYYPVHHDDIGKVLLPQFRDWCDEACQNAVTLHLFNNIFERMGYWKDMAPPAGSFLHGKFKKTGALKFFSAVIPEAVMTHQVNNFKWSQTGEQIGFKSIVKQFAPAFLRSARHHRKKVKQN